jgi:uncharacterized protein YceK
MRVFILTFLSVIILSGCSATWSGVKEDTSGAVDWTKGKVNEGASYVKEKTE